jgi:adrenodoxin-NADP+ reductase
MVKDLLSKQKLHPHFESVSTDNQNASAHIIPVLQSKGVVPVSFADWKKLDQIEQLRGSKLGKPREKITTVAEMVSLLSNNT